MHVFFFSLAFIAYWCRILKTAEVVLLQNSPLQDLQSVRGHIYRVFTSRSSDSQLASCLAFYKFQSKHQTGINRLEIYYYYLILYSVRTETATNQSGIFCCGRTVLSEAKSLRTGTLDLRYRNSLESASDLALLFGRECCKTAYILF